MAEVTIRRARMEDLAMLVTLTGEFHRDHSRIVARANPERQAGYQTRQDWERVRESFLRKNLRSRNAVLFIAEADGIPAGLSLLAIRENMPMYRLRRLGHIVILYVRKRYRGRGISTRLYEEAVQWFSGKGLTNISLNVMSDNPDARAIYKKWGLFDFMIEMRRKI
jgi:GNAT superfamily N-acetyltransferase